MKHFKDYPIENIQEEELDDDEIWLNFMIGESRYEIEVILTSQGYAPENVYHKTIKDQKNCPLCSGNTLQCIPLTENNKEFLHHLISQPALRLRWLTKPKVIKTTVESEEN